MIRKFLLNLCLSLMLAASLSVAAAQASPETSCVAKQADCVRVPPNSTVTFEYNGYCLNIKNLTNTDYFLDFQTVQDREKFMSVASNYGLSISPCIPPYRLRYG